jgi:hypothetical protein
MMIVFNPMFDEMPTITDVWGVLNGSDMLKGFALHHALNEFFPVWLDSQRGEGLDWVEPENITDLYNEWVMKKAAQS